MGIVGSWGSAGAKVGEGGKGAPLPGTLREGSGVHHSTGGRRGEWKWNPSLLGLGSREEVGHIRGWLSMAKMTEQSGCSSKVGRVRNQGHRSQQSFLLHRSGWDAPGK